MLSFVRALAWSSLARAAALAGVVLFPTVLASRALAQQPGQGPPLPAALDLKKVPVGSWAEYSMTVGEMAPMKSRLALVARTGSTITVEMGMEGGMMAMSGGTLTVQTIVDSDPKAKDTQVKKIVMQIANNDPMEMPAQGVQKQFQKPDPKTFVKDETVKVAGGTFKAKHYRD